MGILLLLTIVVIIVGGSILIWPSMLMTLQSAKSIGDVFGGCFVLGLAIAGIIRSYLQCVRAALYNQRFGYYWKTTIKNVTLLPTLIVWIIVCIGNREISIGSLGMIYFFYFLLAIGAGFVLAIVMSIIH